jgi:DNA-binding NarL/FixJ family response regulator
MSIRVLIVDDHAEMRQELRRVFESDVEISVVGEASGGLEAVEKARDSQPDVAILDIGLQKLNGIEAAAWIRRYCARTSILMLSIHSDQAYVTRAVKAGARGYLVKGFVDHEEILRAVHAVHGGGTHFSRLVAAYAQSAGSLKAGS